ncbi:unnamed protein product [Calicophoron daubneyi]|uniref:Peptidase S8/S53 domain-containing protein n=1 Tax=Calicophoron daubneyi TaxID=300641 RepID=A0AAV2TJN2_CALDB
MGPLGQLLPKREINADAFIANNPNCDGRGTLIAIWDTGIDPSAKGLQVTSDGRPKVIDFIDASGSGDVRMKSKQNISETGRTVKTLTGRQVFIPPHWKPVDGVIRIGVKPASELFPKVLLQRLRSEAKEILWKPCIRHLAANLASDLLEAENILTEHEIPRRSSEPSVGGGVCTVAVKSKGKGEPASEESAANENSKTTISRPTSAVPSDYKDTTDYKKQLAHVRSEAWLLERSLSTIDHNYEALDIIYDCFTFNDGSKWVACVDTSPYSRGRSLADMPLLADYTVDRQYACFGEETQLFYTVKIFNDGKLLQIVTNGSGHGTHVAAMSAAFFPSECEGCSDVRSGAASQPQLVRNGVAPGAQLVSIKISDSRLGGMETGISLLRAIRWTVELGCDVVNYSFGEYSVWPNIGRVSKHLIEMINAHGVTMVCSGGNNGPGLGTVGAPGGVVDGIIGK